jgi:iron-sulfur cluster repair protein YtfE (RIC family)
MQPGLFFNTSIITFAAAVLALPHFAVAQSKATETAVTKSKIQIPKSVQAEHEAIHSALVEATKATGRVGSAAKELAEVLHPHFVREEQIALPPLGLLAPLTTGEHVPETILSEALAMSDTLKSELPRMLEEHKKIRAAVDKLRVAARADQATRYQQLAEELALHAQTEEEVLYPAAVLVGDIVRARLQGK